MIDVGPGTRLMCVEAAADCVIGSVYTCRQVFPGMEGDLCESHGMNCPHAGVELIEVDNRNISPFLILAFCLGCFRPIGGDLPAEIVRCLEVGKPGRAPAPVTPPKERVKEDA